MKPIDALKMKNRKNPQTKTELNYLVGLAQRGSIEARNKIVEANINLVLSVAGKYYWYAQGEIDDYFQEGVIGLMRAIETYEPKRDLAFSTYAVWWIKQTMQRYRANHHGTIRVPVYAQQLKHTFERLTKEHPLKGHDEVIDILTKLTRYPRVTVLASVGVDIKIGTIHKTNEHGETWDLEDTTNAMLKDIQQLDVDYLITHLTFREYRIISSRLRGDTLEVIAEREGISRERVRQITEQAVKQMQIMHNLRRS